MHICRGTRKIVSAGALNSGSEETNESREGAAKRLVGEASNFAYLGCFFKNQHPSKNKTSR